MHGHRILIKINSSQVMCNYTLQTTWLHIKKRRRRKKKDNFTIINCIIFQELFTTQWESTEAEEWCFELGIDLLFHQSTEDLRIMTLETMGADNSIMFMQRLLSYQRVRHIHHAGNVLLGMGFKLMPKLLLSFGNFQLLCRATCTNMKSFSPGVCVILFCQLQQ